MAEDKETHTDLPEQQAEQSQDFSDESQTSLEPAGQETTIEHTASEEQADSNSTATSSRKRTTRKHFPWIAATVLLVIVALAAGNYWQFQQGQILKQSQAQLGQQISDATQNIVNLDAQINQTLNQQQSLTQKAQANEQGQQTLQTTLEQMSNQLKELAIVKGKEPLYWKVSEVEYLLSVANHRLILEKDVHTAQTALQDADKRLSAIGDPGLIPIRKQISSEIGHLEQVNLPDIAGLASQLSSMAETIETLPFVKTARDLEPIDKSLLEKIQEDESNIVYRIFQKFFNVQRSDETIEPLLPLVEKHYLKQNLSLKVEQARIALLNHQNDLFQKNLSAIEDWTRKYFDQEDSAVAGLLQTVATLKKVELQPSLPDISNSLRELRAWLSQQKQVAIKPGANDKHHSKLASTSTLTRRSY